MYLERFDNSKHSNIIFQYYNNYTYIDFFRKIPVGLTEEEFNQYWKSTTFLVIHEQKIIGLVSFFSLCSFSLSCQVGIVINKEYWDVKHSSGLKFTFCALLLLGELLFEKGNLNKASM